MDRYSLTKKGYLFFLAPTHERFRGFFLLQICRGPGGARGLMMCAFCHSGYGNDFCEQGIFGGVLLDLMCRFPATSLTPSSLHFHFRRGDGDFGSFHAPGLSSLGECRGFEERERPFVAFGASFVSAWD